jgi:RNA polymerase sigma factor (sigma-70 family)
MSSPPTSHDPTWIIRLRARLALPPRDKGTWIRHLQARDPETCSDLFRLCFDACSRKFRGATTQDYEDLAMEVVCNLLQRIDKQEPIAADLFEIYVVAAAHHACFQLMRRTREQPTLVGDQELAQIEAVPQDTEESELDELERALLLACIARLDAENQRIARWYLEDKGPSEIARDLGGHYTANLVAVRWFRIRARINRYLGQCAAALDGGDRQLFDLYWRHEPELAADPAQPADLEKPKKRRRRPKSQHQAESHEPADERSLAWLARQLEPPGTIAAVTEQLSRMLMALRGCLES